MADVILVSELRCPACATIHTETMPTDACTIRFPCPCGHMLRPKAGDCCVFCSYGSVPCPPIQEARRTGEGGCCT